MHSNFARVLSAGCDAYLKNQRYNNLHTVCSHGQTVNGISNDEFEPGYYSKTNATHTSNYQKARRLKREYRYKLFPFQKYSSLVKREQDWYKS